MFYLITFYYVNYYLTLLTKQRSPLVQCQHIALAHEWRNYGECLTKMWVSTPQEVHWEICQVMLVFSMLNGTLDSWQYIKVDAALLLCVVHPSNVWGKINSLCVCHKQIQTKKHKGTYLRERNETNACTYTHIYNKHTNWPVFCHVHAHTCTPTHT